MTMQSLRSAVVREPVEVDQMLKSLGLSSRNILAVATAAASARSEALPNIDPKCSPGMLSYIHGVRALRREFLGVKGWRADSTGNIESVVNDRLRVRLCFQNVDLACADRDPVAVSGKGAEARRQISAGQGSLFPSDIDSSEPEFSGAEPVVWMICVSADDQFIRAEVSCPRKFEGNNFDGFETRIHAVNISRDTDNHARTIRNDDFPEFEISVVRKASS